MRRLGLGLCLFLAAAGRAQDTTSPAPPEQDPEALAALRRLSEMCPSPGAVGVKAMTCRATYVGDELALAFTGRVVWRRDRPASAAVRLPPEFTDGDARDAVRTMFAERLLSPFRFRAAWDAAQLGRFILRGAHAEGAHRLELRDSPEGAGMLLILDSDGRPGRIDVLPRADAADQAPIGVLRLSFDKVGTHLAPVSEIAEAGDKRLTQKTAYFDLPIAFPMPRRVTLNLPAGKTSAFAFHDVRLDGVLVEGTSLAESLAGRSRRIDDRARTTLRAYDASMSRLLARTASCRIDRVAPTVRVIVVARWTDEGTCECDAAPGAPHVETRFSVPARATLETALAGLLLRPSAEIAEFDATAPVAPGSAEGSTAVVVLTPLRTDHPLSEIRVRMDDRDLPVEWHQEYRDGGPPGLATRTYAEREDGFALVSEVVVRGGYRQVTHWTYYDAEGAPSLRRSMEQTITEGADSVVFRHTYTDWVVDGKPVAGTESAPAAPAAPK
jgi:hypothetical protein